METRSGEGTKKYGETIDKFGGMCYNTSVNRLNDRLALTERVTVEGRPRECGLLRCEIPRRPYGEDHSRAVCEEQTAFSRVTRSI